MIKVKIDGKERLLPSDWGEVTFRMFCDLIEAKNDTTQILSILLDIPADKLKGARFQGLDLVIQKLAFLKSTPPVDEKPTKLGSFTFPQDVGFESIEQFENTKTEINRVAKLDNLKEQTEALAIYAAIYCQVLYDYDRAKVLAKSFFDLPCMEVMAAGSFFQAKCLSMETGYTMNYLRKDILLKKKRPGLNRLLRRLGFILRLTTSRDM